MLQGYAVSPLQKMRLIMEQDICLSQPTVDEIMRSATKCLVRLAAKRHFDDAVLDDFQAVRSMLDALPLSTDQYGLACTRLTNSLRYLVDAEPGAARFELQLLTTSLRLTQKQVCETRQHSCRVA
jgi:hypothetical protein